MKKYIGSFRLFFGTCQIRSIVLFLAGLIVFMILAPTIQLLSSSDFISGFAQGISSMMGALCAVTGLMFTNALYQYVVPTTMGRKFFVSLPDSAHHFRRAVAAANVLGIVIGVVLLAMESVVYLILGLDMGLIILGVILLFLSTGLCNLTGYIKNTAARITSLMAVTCCFGFMAGFFTGGDEETGSAPSFVSQHNEMIWITGGAALAIFAAGLIYSLAVAEKKWGETK